ncbi:methyltransferase family protein [Cryptosporangium minutisporangium]|uniref:Isoprenylcysteine carboxylmethyltransferase family protein n=1 Tax=Cryptosporangium minutisporangium TaxID=113569 RepID=A0ABP6TER4_9ACTN
MAVAALVLYLTGLGLAFGWRSVAQRRRTGDTGLRLHAGPVGSVAWWAKMSFVAALLLGAAAPIAALAGLPLAAVFDRPVSRWLGVLIAVAGVLGVLWCQSGMGASWRVGVDPAERTALVTTGPFAVVRNPIFTAMIATSAGLALMVPTVVAFAALVLLIASVELQVRAIEEPYLRRVHGSVYTAYTAEVGRFLPRIGRASAGTTP